MDLPDSSPTAAPAASDPSLNEPRLLAIGNFDGVHRGHQHLIAQVVEQAAEAGYRPAVMTFDPPPSQVLGRGKKATLTSLALKLELLAALAPNLDILVEPFTLELSRLSPRAFAHQLLEKHRARQVFVGENFRFGEGRRGNLQTLRELGAELGFAAAAAELLTSAGEPISSSRIRQAISAGDLSHASSLLGRAHRLRGVVVAGDRRGRQLGYPTANLDGVEELLPPNGVYCGYVAVEDRVCRAVANIGVRPTLASLPQPFPSVEVHLLDYEGDLYGRPLVFELHELLRIERRFETLDALRRQIALDVSGALQRLPEPRLLRGASPV